jgi:hypothetical protein
MKLWKNRTFFNFILQMSVQGNEKGPESLSDMVRSMFSQHLVSTMSSL